jgi:ketosteroid isomerase-like protein
MLGFVGAAACATVPRGASPDAVFNVRGARMQWNAALADRDSGALARLLEDSAVHVSPRFVHVGRPAYLSVFLHNMSVRPEFRLTYTTDAVTPCEQPSCDIATEYGRWQETWREDGEPTEVSGTYYAIWRRHGDVWQIRSEVFTTLVCRGPRYCGRPQRRP